MRAISLWQPWASAIPAGLKTIETRSWSTAYRGPLAIHSSKRWTKAEREFFAAEMLDHSVVAAFETLGIGSANELPLGRIVATCEIYGCVSTNEDPLKIDMVKQHPFAATELRFGNFSENRFLWFLREIVPLATPFPCVGRQGFFDISLPPS